MKTKEFILKIRERGQITIPSQVRQNLNWRETEIVKVIPLPKEDAFKVNRVLVEEERPKKKLTERQWREIWQRMKEVSKMGRQDVNLTEFLIKEREKRTYL